MSEEYILNTDDQKSEEPKMSDENLKLFHKMEELSKEMMAADIPCLVTAKFPEQTNPTAAWHFGPTDEIAFKRFSLDLAPLLLYVTATMTGTKIEATNPQNGKIVFSIDPSKEQQ